MIKYLPSHEYVKVENDNIAVIGISEFAAKQLGNIVYVDMPEEGDMTVKGDEFGAIESVKAASDLYAPVSGEVIEINEEANDDPTIVGKDPMGAGWIIKVKMNDPSELDSLLDQGAYDDLCAKESH